MTDRDDTATPLPLHTEPLDEHGLLLLNTQAPTTAVHDALNERITQARAMLALVYGHPHHPFQGLSHRLQDSYLWALARQLQVIECLVRRLQ